jgi:hypothetical protein
MSFDPDLRQVLSKTILPSTILPSKISENPSKKDLRCLSLNHYACNILTDSLSRDAYFSVMSSVGGLLLYRRSSRRKYYLRTIMTNAEASNRRTTSSI